MLFVAVHTLFFLGATKVNKQGEMNDPTSEEEFEELIYEAPQRYTWQEYQTAIEPAKDAIGKSKVRMYRNACLQQSDYIMTVDFSEKLANLEEWKVYRQALRDYTNTPITLVWEVPYESLNYSQMNFPQKPPITFL